MHTSRWFFGLNAGGLAIATRRQLSRPVGAAVANGSPRLLFLRRRWRPPDETTSNQ